MKKFKIKNYIIWLGIGIYLLLGIINIANLSSCFAMGASNNINISVTNCPCHQFTHLNNNEASIKDTGCHCIKCHCIKRSVPSNNPEQSTVTTSLDNLRIDIISGLYTYIYDIAELSLNSAYNIDTEPIYRSDPNKLSTIKLLI